MHAQRVFSKRDARARSAPAPQAKMDARARSAPSGLAKTWRCTHAQRALSTAVKQTHGKLKTSEIINILRGHSSAVLVKNDATSLSTWGIQKDKSEAHLRAVIRQGVIRHYLSKNIDAYGTIQVTEKGNAGKLPKAFRVRKELDYDVLNSQSSTSASSTSWVPP